LVRRLTAAALGHESPGAVIPERGFLEAGLDSLGALQLHRALAAETGLDLPRTIVFDFPTPRKLSESLADRVASSAVAEGGTLLGELATLGNRIMALSPDDPARARAAEQLRDLLALVGGAPDGQPPPGAPGPSGAFDSATDEELFQFIDNAGPEPRPRDHGEGNGDGDGR